MKRSDTLHFYTLRFLDEAIERDFQRQSRSRARRHIQIGLGLSVGLWLFFGLLLHPVVDSGRAVVVAVPAMCIYLLASFALTRRLKTLRGLQIVGALSNTVAGLAGLTMVWYEGVFDVLAGQVIMLIVVFSFTLLRLPAIYALIAAAPYLILGAVLAIRSPTFELTLVQAATVLTLTSTVAIGTYLLESATRRDFFLRRIIADQERELIEEKAKQLGQYTLEHKLGAGGMGVVYRARHALLRRPTAVKLLRVDAASPRQLQRFEREVQLTSELTHPNIVQVYDYGRSPEGEFYYAMEYLPGIDLDSLVKRYGPLRPARAVEILLQVCDALDNAHDQGLIHRDIKPANIILSKLGKRLDVAKVVDFGLVHDLQAPAEDSLDSVIAGTPAYMAPEALTSPDEVGPASDLYSLGAVGFFLLTGQPVFSGSSDAEVMDHHIHTDPPSASELAGSSIPEALSIILLRCLAKAPATRFASASDLRTALENVRMEDPWTAIEAGTWWRLYEQVKRSESHPPESETRTMSIALESRDSESTRDDRAKGDYGSSR